ncbi:MAG: aminotransferase [Rhodospirillaceae bacterium]|nr:aminotransferase [Rhodospirillaceae bacterium]|tara:strand:+ start:1467 stop:2621 length:1155 start_codon:yes stop_codon:yes gene_type:complete
MTSFGRGILSDWFLNEELTFLNHGAFGAVPRRVFRAQEKWRREIEAQPVMFLNQVLDPELKKLAERLSNFVGAPPGELVFTCNTTEAISSVAHSIIRSPNDEVLLTDQTHEGVANIFRYLCGRVGAQVKRVALPWPVRSETEIIDAFEPHLTGGVRLVVLDHVTSKQSVVMPLKALVQACQRADCSVIVDGAHAPGMLDLEVSEIGADWYVGNCHKWLLAPKGAAFLVAKDDSSQGIHPATISTSYGKGFWSEFAWTGTRDPSAWLSIGDALDFWSQVGGKVGRDYMCNLADWAGEQLASDWRTERGAISDMTGAMAAVRLPDNSVLEAAGPDTLHDWLLRVHKIEVPIFFHGGSLWLRISTHLYNDESDVSRLSQALLQYDGR